MTGQAAREYEILYWDSLDSIERTERVIAPDADDAIRIWKANYPVTPKSYGYVRVRFVSDSTAYQRGFEDAREKAAVISAKESKCVRCGFKDCQHLCNGICDLTAEIRQIKPEGKA